MNSVSLGERGGIREGGLGGLTGCRENGDEVKKRWMELTAGVLYCGSGGLTL